MPTLTQNLSYSSTLVHNIKKDKIGLEYEAWRPSQKKKACNYLPNNVAAKVIIQTERALQHVAIISIY